MLGIKKKFYKFFNILLLISFLLSLIVFFICIKGVYRLDYSNKFRKQKILWSSENIKFFIRKEILNYKIYLNTILNFNNQISNIPRFDISIKNDSLKKLNSNLPESGKSTYYDAFIILPTDRTKVLKCEVRYRGDTLLHWAYPKKSWRIKLKKDNLFKMERKFNLINPPHHFQLIDFINNDISREEGILTPEYYPVNLYINGKYSGLHIYWSQTDESLLRKFKKMPGSIYTESDGAVPALENGESSMWINEEAWSKVASRNAEMKNNREDIKFMTKIIKNIENNFYENFNLFFNKEQWYKYFAMDNIFGTYHHDFAHNIKLYFDPYKGKIEPIQWDMRVWTNRSVKDTSWYPLLRLVKKNPVLEYERDKLCFNLFKKLKETNIVKDKIIYYKNLIIDSIKNDFNRDTGGGNSRLGITGLAFPYTVKEFEESIENMKETLQKRWHYLDEMFNDCQASYDLSKKDDYIRLKISIDGNSGLKLDLYNIFGNNSIIYKDTDFNFQISDMDRILEKGNNLYYPGRIEYIGNSFNNLTPVGIYGFGKISLKPAPMIYTFFIKNSTKSIRNNIIGENFITESKVDVSRKKIENTYNTNNSIHPWKIKIKETKNIILSGKIDVKENLIYDNNINVTIKEGTVFNIFPGKSIFFYGNVIAIGTNKNKIIFKNAVKDNPYGAVVLQGKDTLGSIFKYCNFENGSIVSTELINYTAQFNIHDTDDFLVENCFIGKNFIGDDSMHISYANGKVLNCNFKGARSDALDIDIADVILENNIFEDSGNDLLDVMTSKIIVKNNYFKNSGDKGISVGEWSELKSENNIFINCNIGIEVKDKSEVFAEKDIFLDSKEKSINLYNKNLRYDEGGYLEGQSLVFINNHKIVKDKKSDYYIFDFKKINSNINKDKLKNVNLDDFKKYIKDILDEK